MARCRTRGTNSPLTVTSWFAELREKLPSRVYFCSPDWTTK